MSDCKTCGHPERWHYRHISARAADADWSKSAVRVTHCNEWGCKCRKFEATK